MPFGRKAGAIRAYEFGCLGPIQGESDAIEAMHGRVRLWNQLVELDHRYDELRKAIIAPHVTGTDEAEQRAQRKAAYKREDVKASLKELDKQEYEEARALWLASGLYWCNHEEVKLAWQQARHKPGALRFHAWLRERGKVTVRWQSGLPVADAFVDNLQLRLAPVDEVAYISPIRAERRRAARSVVSIRVASEDRKPVWLTLPCVLHRQLPPDGVIRSASILRERIATYYRWKLVVLVEQGASKAAMSPCPRNGAVGIDIGWRRLPSGLRVAYWHDDEGRNGEIRLPERWLVGMCQVENLRGIRDTAFNVVRTELAAWLKQQEQLPAWLREATEHISQWRAIGRLAGLCLRWREQRFEGDGTIFPQLEEWRRRDKHLYEYEGNLRDRLLRQRREQYRIFAAGLARQYSEVRLEEFDLRPIARVKDNGKGKELPEAARHYRQWAAVSTLRLAIENACKREGVNLVKVDAMNTTRRCQACGAVDVFDAARILSPTCPECGMIIDQDWRAAINILSQTEAVLVQT